MKTKRLGIKLRNDNFIDSNHFITLEDYTDDLNFIYKKVVELLDGNYNNDSIRQVGIKFEKLKKN